MSSDAEKSGDIIDAEEYKEEMEELLLRYAMSPDKLKFVESFPDASAPFRVAKCYKIEGTIFFKKLITDGEKEGVISALYRFEDGEKGALKDDRAFVRHTLLHEICHILYRHQDCYECDKWAFYQMKRSG